MDESIRQLKYLIYKGFHEQLKKVLNERYHFEASWLLYAIFEDHLHVLIDLCCATKIQQGFIEKIKGIRKTINVNENLQLSFPLNTYDEGYPHNKLLVDLQNWAKARNRLMHGSANEHSTLEDVFERIELVASGGRLLLKDFSREVDKIKRAKRRERLKAQTSSLESRLIP